MFSRFLGKGSHSAELLHPGVPPARGVEVIEDDPEIAWGLWDTAVSQLDSISGPLTGSAHSSFAPLPTPVYREEPTKTAGKKLLSAEQLREVALEVVDLHHHRIATTIRTMWGHAECSPYINRLIMAGGDGLGQSRVGFNQEAVDAMLVLVDLHDAEFGAH